MQFLGFKKWCIANVFLLIFLLKCLFSISSELWFVKRVTFCWAKLYLFVKVIFFASSCIPEIFSKNECGRLGRFNHCFYYYFYFSPLAKQGGQHFYSALLHPVTIEKASYGPGKDVSSLKAISENLKTFWKSIKEDENMCLKKIYLVGEYQ